MVTILLVLKAKGKVYEVSFNKITLTMELSGASDDEDDLPVPCPSEVLFVHSYIFI